MTTSLFRIRGFSVQATTENDLMTTKSILQINKEKQVKTGILLLHGFTATPANFYEYSRALIANGYTVSVPVLPGHGTKPEDLLNIKWTQWLDCVVQKYDALRKECDQVFVIGLSLGGLLALQLAAKRTDIAKLFLLAPAIEPIPLFKIAKACLIPLLNLIGIKYWFHVAGDVKDSTKYEIAYRKVPIHALNELWDCMQQTQRILPMVKTDTIIFQGKIDHETAPKGAQIIFDSLETKHKELIWLENSYHAIPQDFNGLSVIDRILKDIATHHNCL